MLLFLCTFIAGMLFSYFCFLVLVKCLKAADKSVLLRHLLDSGVSDAVANAVLDKIADSSLVAKRKISSPESQTQPACFTDTPVKTEELPADDLVQRQIRKLEEEVHFLKCSQALPSYCNVVD